MDRQRPVVVKNFCKIRLCHWHSLIFFCSLFLIACNRKTESKSEEIKILWKSDKAIGLIIPGNVAGSDTDKEGWSVHLVQENNSPAILGSFRISKDDLVFEPLIPLTRGLGYEVRFNGWIMGSVTIPGSEELPEILNIYPTQDTLPENLLKIYLEFSRPMQTGRSLQFITLFTTPSDTVKDVFLDLQPELWNADNTLLTVWLDPGRIKRDLQPNQKLGAPLTAGNQYTLTVSNEWQSEQGVMLSQSMTKTFVAGQRDESSPDPALWEIISPKSSLSDPLDIHFGEALDYALMLSAISIADENRKRIAGEWKPGQDEKSLLFTPFNKWKKGKYTLTIEQRLEDLAGNNLNRLFDRDLKKSTKPELTGNSKRTFEVK